MKKYDIVIIGGGTSGCAAAYMSAKSGLKTLLVEKNNFLGGLMTGGLVVPIMKSSVNDINNEYYKDLIRCAEKYNAQITYVDNFGNQNDGWLNPEVLKIVLEDLLTSDDVKNNLDILFETVVKSVSCVNKILKSLVLESNLLSIPIESKYFIDATGSAKFSKLCNCTFLDDYDTLQQNSLRFILGNVDLEKFADFIISTDEDRNITNTYRNDVNTKGKIHFTTASTWDTSQKWALDSVLKKAVDDAVLLDSDRAYFQVFSIAGSDTQVAFNCPRTANHKDDPYKASIELVNAKKAIWRLYNFAKKYLKGFENSIITNIASQTGVREQKRVKTKYIYTKNDIINRKTFDNPVLRADYAIDVHSDKKDESVLEKTPAYELPIESLISYDYDNLFVIGKILGADFYAHSALRVQKSCMSTGEGVIRYITNIEEK